jgi:glutamate racemase
MAIEHQGLQQNLPIGIFDSGIGGLTVASAVAKLLPSEHMIYFGDTAHLPYGEKSTAAIQSYAIKICNLLLEKRCKLILIACNSASAAAFDLVKTYVGSKAIVMNVIDPIVDWMREEMPGKNVGLIGTKATVHAGVYQRKVAALGRNITLKSMATPLLASMIEEGFIHNTVSKSVIETYLQAEDLQHIDALVLACTHYPLIKTDIESFYGAKVQVIDPSHLVASAVKASLELHHLTNKQETKGTQLFYVSDYTESFHSSTALFFGRETDLIEHKLWE